MLFTAGLTLLFFLPIIESFNRQIGLSVLLVGALLLSFSTFWKRKLHFDHIELFWILVLILFTLSTTLSWSLSRSYIELLRYFAYFLIFASIRRTADSQSLLKRFLIPMIIVNSLILSFLYIFSPFFNLPQPENKMSLFDPFYMGHNHLADILIFAIPVAFFWEKKFLSLVLSLFFIVMLVFTFSRGAMIALSFAFLLYFIANKLLQKRVLFLAVITIIFLLSSFIYSNFLVGQKSNEGFLKRLYKPVEKENRSEYVIQAWKGFWHSPIFGTGLDTFRYVSKIYQSTPNTWSWYAHNHFLQIFTETGFLGGFLFFTLIISLLIYAFRNINPQPTTHNPQLTAIYIAVFASTLHSIIDFDWQYISIFLLFFMSAALLNAKKEVKVEKKDDILLIVLFSIILVVFLLPIFIKLDSDQLLKDADKSINHNDLIKAENILRRAYRLDYKNQIISAKIAELEVKKGSTDSAHIWYRNAILQDPFYSENIIRSDLRLYLTQAKGALDKKDDKSGYSYILKSMETYPFFYQFIGGDYFLYNANKMNSSKKTYEARKFLYDYISTMNRQINKKKVTEEEILTTVDNFKKMFIDKQ